jgi:hypothetical protein
LSIAALVTADGTRPSLVCKFTSVEVPPLRRHAARKFGISLPDSAGLKVFFSANMRMTEFTISTYWVSSFPSTCGPNTHRHT